MLFFFQVSAGEFRLADYEHAAVTTDLEPDDVLALKILFDEAFRLHACGKSYPIRLVVVGEGNSAVKKIRMETLLKSYLAVPNGVAVPVKEGRSTMDNVFPFDGEELGVKCVPFPHKEEGTEALVEFVRGASRPLIVQLKPVQEIAALSFHKELAAKTEVICYGSFNLRKALHDEEVARHFRFTEQQGVPVRLQMLLDHFGKSFKKVGIVETFGVLGEQGAVYQCYPWTRPIAEKIEQAGDPFYAMLKILITNWNRYKLGAELKAISDQFPGKREIFQKLSEVWSDACFQDLKKELGNKIPEQLERSLNFIHKVRPGVGLQFTLSDVILVLALMDNSFTASPVSLSVNELGFIQTKPDPKSNIFYYDRIDHCKFLEILMPKLAWTHRERLPAAA